MSSGSGQREESPRFVPCGFRLRIERMDVASGEAHEDRAVTGQRSIACTTFRPTDIRGDQLHVDPDCTASCLLEGCASWAFASCRLSRQSTAAALARANLVGPDALSRLSRQFGNQLVQGYRIVADAYAAGVVDRVRDRCACAADAQFAYALAFQRI